MAERMSGPTYDTVCVRVWEVRRREALVDLRLSPEDRDELAASGTLTGLTLEQIAQDAVDDDPGLWGAETTVEQGAERVPNEDGPGPDEDDDDEEEPA